MAQTSFSHTTRIPGARLLHDMTEQHPNRTVAPFLRKHGEPSRVNALLLRAENRRAPSAASRKHKTLACRSLAHAHSPRAPTYYMPPAMAAARLPGTYLRHLPLPCHYVCYRTRTPRDTSPARAPRPAWPAHLPHGTLFMAMLYHCTWLASPSTTTLPHCYIPFSHDTIYTAFLSLPSFYLPSLPLPHCCRRALRLLPMPPRGAVCAPSCLYLPFMAALLAPCRCLPRCCAALLRTWTAISAGACHPATHSQPSAIACNTLPSPFFAFWAHAATSLLHTLPPHLPRPTRTRAHRYHPPPPPLAHSSAVQACALPHSAHRLPTQPFWLWGLGLLTQLRRHLPRTTAG